MESGTVAAVLGGLFLSWALGLWQGYILGGTRKITKSEAARVLARASWTRREGGGYTR